MSQATDYKLVRLANGVFSVRSVVERETFHPVIGPVAEAEELYVRQLTLPARIRAADSPFVVWDVGLGAAANAITVLRATEFTPCDLELHSFDRTVDPLRFALEHAAQLGYFAGYETTVDRLIKERSTTIHDTHRCVRWELHIDDFPALIRQPVHFSKIPPHAILFDPFSPARNPHMWTLDLFRRMFGLLDPKRPCALATYSRSTMLRVSLLVAGFYVGSGIASGEKEETTIAANTPDLIPRPLNRRWLARARRSTSAEPLDGPFYRQAPITPETWERLLRHTQFL